MSAPLLHLPPRQWGRGLWREAAGGVGLSVAWGCWWQRPGRRWGSSDRGARRGSELGRPQVPHCPGRRRAAGPQGCPWRTVALGSAAPQDAQTATNRGARGPPAQHYPPPVPAPLLPACRRPPAMEEDIAPHRSCLPNPRGPTGPSRIPGPPPRRDGPLSAPAAPTKRSCLSVTLCRAGRAGGGPPWERLRGLAPVTPVPPRPRPVTTEGVQRRGGPGGAEAALSAKMGVPCSPPRSGGSPLPGWAGQGGGRHQGLPRWCHGAWHGAAPCGSWGVTWQRIEIPLLGVIPPSPTPAVWDWHPAGKWAAVGITSEDIAGARMLVCLSVRLSVRRQPAC